MEVPSFGTLATLDPQMEVHSSVCEIITAFAGTPTEQRLFAGFRACAPRTQAN